VTVTTAKVVTKIKGECDEVFNNLRIGGFCHGHHLEAINFLFLINLEIGM